MGSILEKIEQAIKDLLIGWIESNLTNMFTDVNDKVGIIASEVGKTPSTWNGSIYSMIRGLSESVIVPIAGIIITFVLCYELISMITEKNNMHEMDTWMFFKWFFKAAVAIYLVTNTFDIVMAVFDIGQSVVSSAGGFIHGSTSIDIDATLASMQASMDAMSIGELLGLSIYSQQNKPNQKNPGICRGSFFRCTSASASAPLFPGVKPGPGRYRFPPQPPSASFP